jgi:twitching motility protein PilT
MNFATKILDFLKENKNFIEIILVPNKEPIIKHENGFSLLFNEKLKSTDIKETLLALRTHAFLKSTLLKKESFSFGLPLIGRIRVGYFLQRGSYTVHITKTPYQFPEIKDIFEDHILFTQYAMDFLKERRGIFIVLGNSWIKNSLFVYSLLKILNKNLEKIVYIVENPISFLIQHEKSIVIQREVHSDVETYIDALNDMEALNPDLIYLSENKFYSQFDFIDLIPYLNFDKLNIISIPSANKGLFWDKIKNQLTKNLYEDFIKNLKDVVEIDYGNENKIRFTIKNLKEENI